MRTWVCAGRGYRIPVAVHGLIQVLGRRAFVRLTLAIAASSVAPTPAKATTAAAAAAATTTTTSALTPEAATHDIASCARRARVGLMPLSIKLQSACQPAAPAPPFAQANSIGKARTALLLLAAGLEVIALQIAPLLPPRELRQEYGGERKVQRRQGKEEARGQAAPATVTHLTRGGLAPRSRLCARPRSRGFMSEYIGIVAGIGRAMQ